MSAMKSIFITLSITLFTFLGLLYTNDLEQKNKETIFLTHDGQIEYAKFQEEFSEKDIIVVKKEIRDDLLQFGEKLAEVKSRCRVQCEIIGPENIPVNLLTLFKLKGEGYRAFIIIADKEEAIIKKILANLAEDPYWGKIGEDLHFIGAPFTNSLLDGYSKNIKQTLFPLLFIGIFIAILLITRSFKSAITLFLPCISAASLSLVTIKLIYKETNLIFAVIPLIVFVITLSLAMHIYYTAVQEKSVKSALKNKKKPILLMLSTTYIGFLSLKFSEIEVIGQFGLLSSSLILVSSAITILWLSQIEKVLSFMPAVKGIQYPKIHSLLLRAFASAFTLRSIIILCFGATLFGIWVFPKIPTITDATTYFPKSSGIKASIQSVAKTVIGQPILEIVIETKDDFSIDDLQKVSVLESDIQAALPKLVLLSLNTLVAKANEAYSGSLSIPQMQISYAALASKIPPALGLGYPSFEKKYRISILGGTINVREYEDILVKVNRVLQKQKIKYSINGLYYHLMIAQKNLINTFLKSFLFSLLLISIIAFASFRKFKVFYIFLIVNIVPVMINFIAMYLLGLSFNIATVMTYSISLGLIVDSTFHIIHAIDTKLSAEYFYETVTIPVLLSSSLLSFAFILFYFNDFLPIREFGICLSIIIATAMIFDLKILPRLYAN